MPEPAVVTRAVSNDIEPVTGLILSGGGARAAYQVGVLAGIADLL
ncbi:patatin-like phospholipase family protein, partial [Pseudomonas syringae]|nr:patatin-like phospholipase family protein [Pseudomonas syringae]